MPRGAAPSSAAGVAANGSQSRAPSVKVLLSSSAPGAEADYKIGVRLAVGWDDNARQVIDVS